MKKIILFASLFFAICIQSCDIIMHDTIKGNGKMTTDNRSVSASSRIKTMGPFDVEIVIGTQPSVKIDADENLMPYILVDNQEGRIVVHTKNDVNLSSNNNLKVTVTVSTVEELELYGNGNITCNTKITGGNQLKLGIYGNGDAKLDINTPSVESTIGGNGNILLTGETKNSKIEIDGNGEYKAEGLQAENAEVHINGSGGARLSCSVSLDVHVAGSGDIYYKGSPRISQSILGSGSIHQIQ